MRYETRFWIGMIVLFLLLSGAITLGDIFGVIFTIIGFFLLLAIVGMAIFRSRVRRAQREAASRGEEFKGYSWHFGGQRENTSPRHNPDEGKVTVERTVRPKKRVNEDVGEYVDFEEK